MKDYLDVARRIIDEGVWIENKRTHKRCKTIINVDMAYDVGAGLAPVVTTRKCYIRQAIAELLGYLRGYDSAAQFRAIGANTWDANANDNIAWLNNSVRKGNDDMGRVYGVQGRDWTNQHGMHTDQLMKIIGNLKKGIDDRGEILTFWNPGEFHLGCLRPCMHTHTFSILGDTLHSTSYQRSSDWPLGQTFNQIQCYVLLLIMARITGYKPGIAYHKIVNAHIYEDQIPGMMEQIQREPYPLPSLVMSSDIKTIDDVLKWVTPDHFSLVNYQSHPPIKYPFSV